MRLEAGDTETVLRELRRLDEKYDWTYQRRGPHYDEFVDAIVKRMNEQPAANRIAGELTPPSLHTTHASGFAQGGSQSG